MPVDNDIYTVPRDIWWDEGQPLSSLRTAINPGRVGYLKNVLARAGRAGAGMSALDIGCGGGLMAEEVARMGFRVTGVDPAKASIDTAAAHARQTGLAIDYKVASGESLPFTDGSFDLVYCCDVLEHVSNVTCVVAESARVLRSGGIYFFDTVNRTRASRFLMIKLFQEWKLTAWMPKNLHSWDRFITPEELSAELREAGLAPQEMTGLAPDAVPPKLLIDLVRLRLRRLTFGDFGRRSAFRQVSDLSVVYAGFAIKA